MSGAFQLRGSTDAPHAPSVPSLLFAAVASLFDGFALETSDVFTDITSIFSSLDVMIWIYIGAGVGACCLCHCACVCACVNTVLTLLGLTCVVSPLVHKHRQGSSGTLSKGAKRKIVVNSRRLWTECCREESAAEMPSSKVVRFLVRKAGLVGKGLQIMLDQCNTADNNYRALHYCSMYDKVEVAKYLLSVGASPDVLATKLQTPLHLAQSAEMVLVLVQSGANPDIPDSEGYPPLVQAIYDGNVKIVEHLMKAKANPYYPISADGRPEMPLTLAVRKADIDTLFMILSEIDKVHLAPVKNMREFCTDALKNRDAGNLVWAELLLDAFGKKNDLRSIYSKFALSLAKMASVSPTPMPLWTSADVELPSPDAKIEPTALQSLAKYSSADAGTEGTGGLLGCFGGGPVGGGNAARAGVGSSSSPNYGPRVKLHVPGTSMASLPTSSDDDAELDEYVRASYKRVIAPPRSQPF